MCVLRFEILYSRSILVKNINNFIFFNENWTDLRI